MRKTPQNESGRWLTQARVEFTDADELRKRGRYYIALFHFQQSAEKALKGYLCQAAESVEIIYTHSIAELLEMATEVDPDFKDVWNTKKLDVYYIQTRYPNGLPGGVPAHFFDDPKEAEEAMQLARNLIELVEQKLSM